MIGQTISHYKIIEELGRGGMGVVYKAEDTKLNRLVALKFLPAHARDADDERARFMQEAQAAAALNHPNICTIYRIDEADGREFIEMELVEGVTMREKLPVRSADDAIDYAIQIAEALQEAHAKGIIHRDIKAENIMVNARNQAKVMDFGLAKLKGTVRLTKTTSTVGTLAYMSPESVQGEDADPRSDIFSFGVVLFEMLTGHLPFRGEHDAALMYSILNEEPADAATYLPDLSPEIGHILSRTLEKEPADRYQSAADLIIDLRRARRDSTRIRRSGTIPASTQAEPERKSRAGGIGSLIAQRKSLLFGMLAVLGGLAILWFGLRKGETDSPRFGSMRMKQITSVGTTGFADISPDGRYVVHTQGNRGKTSLVMRQIATMSSVEIVPPADRRYIGTTFSDDANHVYYVYMDERFPRGIVTRVPILGGQPAATATTDVFSPVSLSPDGEWYCFVRPISEKAEEALVIARIDGTEERKLVSRYDQEFFLADDQGPGWSPDGRFIAAGVATTAGGFHSNLMKYSVADGTSEVMTDKRFHQIGRVVWLHSGEGVVFSAQERSSDGYQLWYAPVEGNEVTRLTNDLNSYGTVSLGLTSDDRTLVTLRSEATSSLWIAPRSRPEEARKLPGGVMEGNGGVAWSPDGKSIAYVAHVSANTDIWLLDLESGERLRLTTDPGNDFFPNFAPDGSLVYTSESSGTANIWRMQSDGSGKRQITHTENYFAEVTPDGKSVVYYGFATGFAAIWKSPMDGGDPVQLTQTPARSPAISPDGTRIACLYSTGPERSYQVAIIPIEGGEPITILERPSIAESRRLLWSRDGKEILFIGEHQGAANVWGLPVDGGPARQITMFGEDWVSDFGVAPNGDIACARSNIRSDVVLIEDFITKKNE
ncbi:MAG: serine/threonine-protein kinase [Ignavibacteria bacterium]|nr:serine/threonine-protein kinase [Ignavibacteria bacterium]